MTSVEILSHFIGSSQPVKKHTKTKNILGMCVRCTFCVVFFEQNIRAVYDTYVIIVLRMYVYACYAYYKVCMPVDSAAEGTPSLLLQVVQDIKYFQRVKWQYMILDEAQAIKSSTRLGGHAELAASK